MQVEQLVRQLTGPGFLELDDRRRHEEWHRLRALARERLGRAELAALPAADRVRGELLLAGRAEACRRFALAELAIRATTRCQQAAWHADGLRVDVDGLLDRPGDPLFEAVDGRVLLRVPSSPDVALPDQGADVTAEAVAGAIRLVLRGEGEDRELDLASGPDALGFDDTGTRLRFRVRVRIDPATLGSGRWQSYLRIVTCGWTVDAPLDLGDAALPAAVLPDHRFAAPITRPLGLTLSETLPPAALPTSGGASGSTDVRVTRTDTHVRIVLDLSLHAAGDATPGSGREQRPLGTELPLSLVPDPGALAHGDGAAGDADTLTVPGRLTCGPGGVGTLEAAVHRHRLHSPGRYALCVDGARLGLDLVLDTDGRASALATPAVSVVGTADRVHGEGLEWVGDLTSARGEYVVFGLDDADLSDASLTTLAAYGRQHGAEIVQVRHPDTADPYDRPRTDLPADPTLLEHGVPGTLYARRLLERAGIDPAADPPLLFDALAHAHAASTAVLGAATDHLPARELARFSRPPDRDGAGAFSDTIGLDVLEGAFAALVQRVEPGPHRDRVLQHWLRTELLDRVRGQALVETGPAGRAALIAAVRRILTAYCAGQAPSLPPVPRTAAELLHGARTESLVRLARWERDLRAVQDRPVELSFTEGAVLQVSAGVRLDGARAGGADPPTLLIPGAGSIADPGDEGRDPGVDGANGHEPDRHGAAASPTGIRDAAAYSLRDGVSARLLLYDDQGRAARVRFATPATASPQVADADGSATPYPRFDLTTSVDLGREAGRRLPPGVWRLRLRLDCLGVVRHLDPTARSADLPGGERRSRASARFGDEDLALAIGVDVDGSIELLRVPTPHVRARGPLRRLVHRFTARRTHARRNT